MSSRRKHKDKVDEISQDAPDCHFVENYSRSNKTHRNFNKDSVVPFSDPSMYCENAMTGLSAHRKQSLYSTIDIKDLKFLESVPIYMRQDMRDWVIANKPLLNASPFVEHFVARILCNVKRNILSTWGAVMHGLSPKDQKLFGAFINDRASQIANDIIDLSKHQAAWYDFVFVYM